MTADDEPRFEIPPWWPHEFVDERVALWSSVNWLLPICLVPAQPGSEEDYLALKPQILPRVPIAGEQFELPGCYATVEHVRWTADGRVTVRLRRGHVEAAFLDALRQSGWTVFPRHDADDWLHDTSLER